MEIKKEKIRSATSDICYSHIIISSNIVSGVKKPNPRSQTLGMISPQICTEYIIRHFHILGARSDIKKFSFTHEIKYQMMMSGDCIIIVRQTRIRVEINIHILRSTCIYSVPCVCIWFCQDTMIRCQWKYVFVSPFQLVKVVGRR